MSAIIRLEKFKVLTAALVVGWLLTGSQAEASIWGPWIHDKVYHEGRWPEGTLVKYKIYSRRIPAASWEAVAGQIENASNTWNSIGGASVQFQYAGEASAGPVDCNDPNNSVSFEDGEGDWYPRLINSDTCLNVVNNGTYKEIKSFHMTFYTTLIDPYKQPSVYKEINFSSDPSDPDADAYFRTQALHEFGHALGLPDSSVSTDIMYDEIPRSAVFLTRNDIRKLYYEKVPIIGSLLTKEVAFYSADQKRQVTVEWASGGLNSGTAAAAFQWKETEIIPGAYSSVTPSVAVDDAGHVWVAWKKSGDAGEIWLSQRNLSGNVWVNVKTPYTSDYPPVLAFGDGHWMLFYIERPSLGRSGMVSGAATLDGVNWEFSGPIRTSYSAPATPAVTGGLFASYCPTNNPVGSGNYYMYVGGFVADGKVAAWHSENTQMAWRKNPQSLALMEASPGRPMPSLIEPSVVPSMACSVSGYLTTMVYPDARDDFRLKLLEARAIIDDLATTPNPGGDPPVHFGELPGARSQWSPAVAWAGMGTSSNPRTTLFAWFPGNIGPSKVMIRGGTEAGEALRYGLRSSPSRPFANFGGRGGISAAWAYQQNVFEGFVLTANTCQTGCW